MGEKKYINILKHYESCLDKYGDTHYGVDWPKKEDVDKRYKVMLELVNFNTNCTIRILDFGCGASHLYEYILKNNIKNIEYAGLDFSKKFIELSEKKYPYINYYCVDILDNGSDIPKFDYIIINGVFTEKVNLSFDEMFTFFKKMIKKIFNKANIGIAFNVMSKHVDWEREDLFHLPFDLLGKFLTTEISRNFIIRNDYGLYEYTTYVYRNNVSKRGEK